MGVRVPPRVPSLSRSLKELVTLQGRYNADDDWLYGIGDEESLKAVYRLTKQRRTTCYRAQIWRL
jgi:hypothetical protein